MAERVGWTRGSSAAAVLGLYCGFMVAVAVAVIYPEDPLRSAAKAWGITMIVSIITLTPFLSRGRKRGRPETLLILENVRDDLQVFNEGVNRWRALSHIRREGTGVSIKILDSSKPMAIVKQAITHANICSIQFRIKPREDAELRSAIISYLVKELGASRVSKKNNSITLMQPLIMDRATIITRSMMMIPPLMLMGIMAFDSFSPGNLVARISGGIAGMFLGIMIITNRGR
ncbi:MAG: hypothetical protein ACKVJ7_03185 [Candidatus Poseidoniales archaeon]|jgi:hypothetical protein